MGSSKKKTRLKKTREVLGKNIGLARHVDRAVEISSGYATNLACGPVGHSPAMGIGIAIRDALDPTKASGKVTNLSDMSAEKRAEMERLYGKR